MVASCAFVDLVFFAAGGRACLLIDGKGFIRGDTIVRDVDPAADDDAVGGFSKHIEQFDRSFATSKVEIDSSVDAESVEYLKWSAFVDQHGITEGAAPIRVAIQQNAAGESLIDEIHFAAPVVCGNSTVAEAGGVTSAPGEGMRGAHA